MDDESKFFQQKAKIVWLRNDDCNSGYFHKIVKRRMHKGRIVGVCDEQGYKYDGRILQSNLWHFQIFLGIATKVEKMEDINSLFVNKVSEMESGRMISEVTNEEIKNALFDIDDNEAPGRNGYTTKFFERSLEHCWCKDMHNYKRILQYWRYS